jgi:hypothetical protein
MAAHRRGSHRSKTTGRSTAAHRRGCQRSRSGRPHTAVHWLQFGAIAAALGAAITVGDGVASAAPADFSPPANTGHASSDHLGAGDADAAKSGPQVAPHAIHRTPAASPSKSVVASRHGSPGTPTESARPTEPHPARPFKRVDVATLSPGHLPTPTAPLGAVTLPGAVSSMSTHPVVISPPVIAPVKLKNVVTGALPGIGLGPFGESPIPSPPGIRVGFV